MLPALRQERAQKGDAMKLLLQGTAQLGCMCCVAAVLTLGCAADPEPTAPGMTTSPEAEAEAARCPVDTPVFSAAPDSGLLVLGNRNIVQGRIVQAEPAQPERFENDWTVQFSDAAGAPLDDLTIANACAFMPVHGHGGVPKEVVKSGPATFTLTGLNLFMRGPWEVQLAVSSVSAAGATALEATSCDRDRRQAGNDLLIFRACISDD